MSKSFQLLHEMLSFQIEVLMLLSVGCQLRAQLLKADLEVQAALPPELKAQINTHAGSWLGTGLPNDLQNCGKIYQVATIASWSQTSAQASTSGQDSCPQA